jgi:hypothetical protein
MHQHSQHNLYNDNTKQQQRRHSQLAWQPTTPLPAPALPQCPSLV